MDKVGHKYDMPLEDRRRASIDEGQTDMDQEPKFTNQIWSSLIQIGIPAASKIRQKRLGCIAS